MNHSDMNDESTREDLLSEGEVPVTRYDLGEDEAPIRSYLLGELTPDERQQVEVRLLTDDEFHEQVGVIEDELIDEYLYGELPDGERRRLGEILRSAPELRRKLQLAEDLRASALEPAPATPDSGKNSRWQALLALLRFRSPVLGFSLALSLLLCALGGLWLITKVRRLEAQLARQGAAPPPDARGQEQELQRQLEEQRARLNELTAELRRAQEQREQLDEEIAALKTQTPPRPSGTTDRRAAPKASALASVFLPLIQDRGSGATPTLNVSPGTDRARLTLGLDVLNPAAYKHFEATVQEVGGREVWSAGQLTTRRKGSSSRVVLNLPASRLSAGDYQVKLNGLKENGQQEPIGIYYFRVQTNRR